jgi:hypothetical protein
MGERSGTSLQRRRRSMKKKKLPHPKKLVLVKESLHALNAAVGGTGTTGAHCTHYKTCTC